MKYTREDLINRDREWTKDDFIFFWQPGRSSRIDKGCFSQWFMSDFIVEGQRFCCAEQYMMAKKAFLFHDDEVYNETLKERSPKRIRELGRMVKNFDPKVWNEHKTLFVREANIAKFTQNAELRDFICRTDGKILVEASPYDRIWGIGLYASSSNAVDPSLWRGSNLLGFTLMEVRDEILSQSHEPL